MQLQQNKLENIINKRQTVVSVARELAVSRQTVHKWLIRYKRFGLEGIVRKKRKTRNGCAHNRTPEAVRLFRIATFILLNNFTIPR